MSASDTPILVCDCGKRLKAPGATPGRVGRCPACGGLLRVQEMTTASGPRPKPRPASVQAVAVPAEDRSPPSTASEPQPARKRRRRPGVDAHPTAIWDGLIAAPARPETSLRESLWYPLWGATGIAALVILPPLLWLASALTIGGLVAILGGNGSFSALMGLFFLLSASIPLFCVMGYTLLFLGRVLAASALGEMHHPHWPDWEFTPMWHGLARWAWAGLVGGVVGGFPATVYWVYCGDIDAFDAIILAELLAVGAAYALMALLASILHDDTLGANPITVLSAIYALGWSYARPCLVAGGAVLVVATLATAVERFNGRPGLSALLLYLTWLIGLYAAMVVLRVLGLHYHAHARTLGWFRGRTGWGV